MPSQTGAPLLTPSLCHLQCLQPPHAPSLCPPHPHPCPQTTSPCPTSPRLLSPSRVSPPQPPPRPPLWGQEQAAVGTRQPPLTRRGTGWHWVPMVSSVCPLAPARCPLVSHQRCPLPSVLPTKRTPTVSPAHPHSPLRRTLAIVPVSRWVLPVTSATRLETVSPCHPRPHTWVRAIRVGTGPPCHPWSPQKQRRGPLPPMGTQSHSQGPNIPPSIPILHLWHVTHGVPSCPQGLLVSFNTPKVDPGIQAPLLSLTCPPLGPAATAAGPRPLPGPPALEQGTG